MSVSEIILWMNCCERRSTDICVEIQGYHGNNIIFISLGFDKFISENDKIFTLYGIGSHHKNGGSE